MDSTMIVNSLAPHIGFTFANAVFGILCVVIPALYRILITWANNRPTTWYWNPLTKSFITKRADRWIARVCGRGVNDCKAKYEENLPAEAKEELKKHLIKKYPLLQIEVPGENNQRVN